MSVTEPEVKILLNDLIDRYGYDFTGYAEASLTRRITRLFQMDRFSSFSEFRHRILNNTDYFRRLVEQLTVNVTEMLRDPLFYKAIREEVIPVLATYPFIRIWHAGCSTGEEVYSMAIMLKEAGILQKSRLYATDINPMVIEKARKGIFPVSQMRKYSENYIQSGGTRDFSSYYVSNYNLAKFDEGLGEKMIYATHNLVSDSSFNDFQLIVCRNTLIYFDRALQSRVLQLFDNSLELLGFLALGTKESLRFAPVESKFKIAVPAQKIWRKIR